MQDFEDVLIKEDERLRCNISGAANLFFASPFHSLFSTLVMMSDWY